MKNTVCKLLLPVFFIISFMAVNIAQANEIVSVRYNDGYHRGHHREHCRWIPGHWRHGKWHPAHKECFVRYGR